MTRDNERPTLRYVPAPSHDAPSHRSPASDAAGASPASSTRPDAPRSRSNVTVVRTAGERPYARTSAADDRRSVLTPATSRDTAEVSDRARAAVMAENRHASAITATDARWVLAARVAHELEGGKLAMLRPHRRASIDRLAVTLGLRPFDAQLIIAIVQDNARTTGSPLGHTVVDRLSLVRPASSSPTDRSAAEPGWHHIVLAALLGMLIALVAVLWILRA